MIMFTLDIKHSSKLLKRLSVSAWTKVRSEKWLANMVAPVYPQVIKAPFACEISPGVDNCAGLWTPPDLGLWLASILPALCPQCAMVFGGFCCRGRCNIVGLGNFSVFLELIRHGRVTSTAQMTGFPTAYDSAIIIASQISWALFCHCCYPNCCLGTLRSDQISSKIGVNWCLTLSFSFISSLGFECSLRFWFCISFRFIIGKIGNHVGTNREGILKHCEGLELEVSGCCGSYADIWTS